MLARLTQIEHILLVLSGKGGVGKSSVSVQLALSLLATKPGARVGLLDVDLTGPSLPRMLGLDGQDVHQSEGGWVPVYLDGRAQVLAGKEGQTSGGGVLACMSIGFLLANSRESVVWRGPKKNAMIKQFLAEVRWGKLDYLIIDTPPGQHHIPLSSTPGSRLTRHSLQAPLTNTSRFSRRSGRCSSRALRSRGCRRCRRCSCRLRRRSRCSTSARNCRSSVELSSHFLA